MSDIKSQGIALELRKYFQKLGIRSESRQLALYNDLQRFHSDPNHPNRRVLSCNNGNYEVDKEWKCLVRKVGPRHLNHRDAFGGSPDWKEPDFERYRPLRSALLYLCQAWRRVWIWCCLVRKSALSTNGPRNKIRVERGFVDQLIRRWGSIFRVQRSVQFIFRRHRMMY